MAAIKNVTLIAMISLANLWNPIRMSKTLIGKHDPVKIRTITNISLNGWISCRNSVYVGHEHHNIKCFARLLL